LRAAGLVEELEGNSFGCEVLVRGGILRWKRRKRSGLMSKRDTR
jgi:hypothetical protein